MTLRRMTRPVTTGKPLSGYLQKLTDPDFILTVVRANNNSSVILEDKSVPLPSDSLLTVGHNPVARKASSIRSNYAGSVKSYRSYRSHRSYHSAQRPKSVTVRSVRSARITGNGGVAVAAEKTNKHPTRKDVGLGEVLLNARVLQALSGTVFGASCQGLLEACLEQYLETFNLTITTIGLTFLGLSLPYFLSSPLFGHACDHWVNPKILQPIGHIVVAIGK